jgi:hypothetical protein
VSEGKVREKTRKYISCAEIVQGAPQRCSILHLYGGGKKKKTWNHSERPDGCCRGVQECSGTGAGSWKFEFRAYARTSSVQMNPLDNVRSNAPIQESTPYHHEHCLSTILPARHAKSGKVLMFLAVSVLKVARGDLSVRWPTNQRCFRTPLHRLVAASWC